MDEVERKSVMLDILYEDKDILVVVKPAGVESQTSRRLEPDMVSEIKNYLHRKVQETKKLSTGLSPKASTAPVDPYVGVIPRLDKPVRGVMVYAKNLKAAAHLSRQVQEGKLEKIYQALVCGKPVDNVGKYVDYLLKDGKTNTSRIVDKSVAGAKRAELEYQILEKKEQEDGTVRSLVEIHLHTGRTVCRAWDTAHGRYQVWRTSGCFRGTCPSGTAGAVRGPFIVPSPGDGKKNGVFHQTAICSVSELFYKSRK